MPTDDTEYIMNKSKKNGRGRFLYSTVRSKFEHVQEFGPGTLYGDPLWTDRHT